MSGVAGGPLGVGDDLHPRHLPPKQDAQSAQPDQGAGADGPNQLQRAALPEDSTALLDGLGGQRLVGHFQHQGGLIRPPQGDAAQDGRAFGQFLTAVVALRDLFHPIQLHARPSFGMIVQ